MTNKEAIDIINNRLNTYYCTNEDLQALDLAIKALEERPTGKWIVTEEMLNIWECSNCKEEYCSEIGGTPYEWNYNFCPNCGARMEAEND